MIKTSNVELLTYVSLDSNREYHSPAVSAFKSGADYYFCNQALLKAQAHEDDLLGIKNYFGTIPYSVWATKEIAAQNSLHLSHDVKFLEHFLLMVSTFRSLSPSIAKEGVVIKELTDLSEVLTVWSPLVAQAFGTTNKSIQTFTLYLKTTPIAPKLHFFVAFLHEAPVATTLLINHDNFVAMDWVGTDPAFRKQGFGFAVACNALHALKQPGEKEILLLATEQAQSLYTKIGFNVIDCYNVYTSH